MSRQACQDEFAPSPFSCWLLRPQPRFDRLADNSVGEFTSLADDLIADCHYRRHFDSIPVEVSGNSPQHEVKGTIWVDKPKVSSGSDTYPLDAAAALTADRKTLTVAIVNPTESEQQINVAIKGVTVQDKGRLWRIAAAELTADNEPGKPLVVDIVQSPLTGVPGRLTVPKLSMSIYELPLR